MITLVCSKYQQTRELFHFRLLSSCHLLHHATETFKESLGEAIDFGCRAQLQLLLCSVSHLVGHKGTTHHMRIAQSALAPKLQVCILCGHLIECFSLDRAGYAAVGVCGFVELLAAASCTHHEAACHMLSGLLSALTGMKDSSALSCEHRCPIVARIVAAVVRSSGHRPFVVHLRNIPCYVADAEFASERI